MKSPDPFKPIAIVGAACRLPGGIRCPADFWDVLIQGRDVITSIGPGRFNRSTYEHPDPKEPGKSYTFAAGVLENIRAFDAEFFGISPREAAQMDPQQRILLELTWEALESGGLAGKELAGSRTGVYVGVSSTDYATLRFDDPAAMDAQTMVGNTQSLIANRISYIFDWHGPSLAIDTACSSSLVALHHACMALCNGEATLCAVAGINALLSPVSFVGFSKASMLSPEGRCKAFDASGKGYVRSEGGVVVFLKPLADALREKDRIFGVIRGTGINCDGRTNGISFPDSRAQECLLRAVYENSGVNPAEVFYVEAHGTGTAAGDPVEAEAIGKAIGRHLPAGQRLKIGSAKTNVGHLEPASGLVGLLKSLLILEKGTIPPSLHFSTPNPRIDFDGWNLSVVTAPEPCPARGGARYIGVNSFGVGGANAHVILEAAPDFTEPASKHAQQEITNLPLVLCAKSRGALYKLALAYAQLIERSPAEDFYSIARAACFDRKWHEEKLLLRPTSPADAVEKLGAFANGRDDVGVVCCAPAQAKIALVYSGNGAQWAGMAHDLLKGDPEFAKALQRTDTVLEPLTGWKPTGYIQLPVAEQRLEETSISQPLLFAIQAAMTDVLRDNGVRFHAVFGHSVGEVAAAYAAGGMTLEEAARVIVARSQAQEVARGQGRMASVGLSAADVALRAKLLGLSLEVSALNGPDAVTVSGLKPDLDRLEQAATKDGIFFRHLNLDYAFHSRFMDPVKEPLEEALAGLSPSPGTIPYISTVTGEVLDTDLLVAEYWWHNVREPVLFANAVRTALQMGITDFVEVGPHAILQYYLNETIKEAGSQARTHLMARRDQEHVGLFRRAVDTCVLLTGPEALRACFPVEGQRVDLPLYCWEHEDYWYPATHEGSQLVHGSECHPLLGTRVETEPPVWIKTLDTRSHEWLADHRAGKTVLYPAAGFLELFLAACAELKGKDAPLVVRQMEIRRPMPFHEGQSRTVRVRVVEASGLCFVESRPRFGHEDWTLHAVATLATDSVAPADIPPPAGKVHLAIDAHAHYLAARQMGLEYGPAFQTVRKAEIRESTIEGELAFHADIASLMSQMVLPPVLLDGAFQLLIDLLKHLKGDAGHSVIAYLASRMGYVRVEPGAGPVTRARTRWLRTAARSIVAEVDLYDAAGRVAARLRDCRFQQAPLQQQSHWSDIIYAWSMVPVESVSKTLAQSVVAALEELPPENRDFELALARYFEAQTAEEQDKILREWIETHPSEAGIWTPFLDAASSAFDGGRPAWLEAYLDLFQGVSFLNATFENILRTAACPRPTVLLLAPESAGVIKALASAFEPEALRLFVTHPDPATLEQLRAEAGAIANCIFQPWEEPVEVDLIFAGWLHPSLEKSPEFLGRAAAWAGPNAPFVLARETNPFIRGKLSEGDAQKWTPFVPPPTWTPVAHGIRAGVLEIWHLLPVAGSKPKTKPVGTWTWIGATHPALDQLADAGISCGTDLPTDATHFLFATALNEPDALRAVASLLEWVQAQTSTPSPNELTVVILTSGAWDVNPGMAGLWGMARVLANEYPKIRFRLLDFDKASEGLLSRALVEHGHEAELILQGGHIFAPRMRKKVPETGRETNLRLDTPSPGLLDRLEWQEVPTRPLQDHEVEVRVEAVGLNFRDVMWAMGLLPDEALEAGFAGPTLGLECAGVVTRTGTGETRFQPGDRVMGFAPASFSRCAITTASALVHLPEKLSSIEGATISSTFFTAYYCLHHLARLRAGEKVLIHGAAGGLGLAAIQLAKRAGAEIFATVGSPAKRAVVRAMGADHILNSRNLDFADEVRRINHGAGVDVVLNSLAGEAMQASIDLLNPGGRFLELGKRDFYANSRLAMRALRNNIAYFGVDADQLMRTVPELCSRLFGELMQLFEEHALRPIAHCVLPAHRVVDAFRLMQQSKHLGKVVVTMHDHARLPVKPMETTFRARADGTYLVIGGLGGFGLATAAWLVCSGAKHLLLAGRSGASSAEARSAIESWRAQGIVVDAVAADATNEEAVKALLAPRPGFPAIVGIIHSAMVLDDRLAANMDAASLEKVWAPKVRAAELLDRHSRHLALDWFVLYSSATTFIGNPGQANYVAANAVLESLARRRSAEGLPTLAVAWGAIDDAGHLVHNEQVREMLAARLGKEPLTAALALKVLGELLARGTTGCRAVFPVEWPLVRRGLPLIDSPAYEWMNALCGDAFEETADATDFQTQARSLSEAQLRELVEDGVRNLLAHILRLAPEKIVPGKPIAEMGMDSLMSLEMGLAIERHFGIEPPVIHLSTSLTPASLSAIILKELLSEKESSAMPADAAAAQVEAILETHGIDPSAPEVAELVSEVLKDGSEPTAKWQA